MNFNELDKIFEEHTGMTPEQYQQGIADLLTPAYLAEAEENKETVRKWLINEQPIYYKHGNKAELILQDDEYFVPCFDPDIPGRQELPTYWFISNFGNLITVNWAQGYGYTQFKKVYAMHASADKFKFWMQYHPVTHRNKTITAYTLLALCFPGPDTYFGLAHTMVNRYGIYAWAGAGQDRDCLLNSHHAFSRGKYPELILDSRNIQLDTNQVHSLMRESRRNQAEDDIDQDYLRRFEQIMQIECPGHAVMMTTNGRYDDAGNLLDTLNDYRMYQLDGPAGPAHVEMRWFNGQLRKIVTTEC